MLNIKDRTLPKLNLKTKRNDKITFMIMGGPNNPVKDYQVSARLFKFCFTFFCIALITVGAVSYYIVQEYMDNRVALVALVEENGSLTDTTKNQEVMIQDLQHITGNMLTKLEEIESLNTEVRTKVGLEESAEGETQVVAGYMVSRGSSTQLHDVDVDEIDADFDTLEDLKLHLLNMDLEMTARAMELLVLKDDVEKQLDFEEALPSLWPMEGIYTSAFGNRRDPFGRGIEFHQGIDIANRSDTPIYAAGKGVVTFAGWKQGWGNMVLINHGYGYVSQYAHCTDMLVSEGQEIERGQLIATCGRTGRATGTHLHFGVQFNGVFIDPMKVLQPK